jgi:hypothetical protein
MPPVSGIAIPRRFKYDDTVFNFRIPQIVLTSAETWGIVYLMKGRFRGMAARP